jgi:predicted O-linked N-acetylglucosamine transferase (SPINDLY family)
MINAKRDLFDALYFLAVVQRKLGKKDAALVSYDRALTMRPDFAEALYRRGNVLRELKRLEDALASYDRALAVRPAYAEALYNRGNVLRQLKRFEEAMASYDRALTVRPDFAEALSNRGTTLHELKRFEEALASYDRALAVRPDFAEALSNRGNVLHELKRFAEALASYDRALTVRPDYAQAHYNRGNVLHELKRFEEALASYDRALTVRPDDAQALSNRGNVLHELKRFAEALASYDRALTVQPDYAQALYNRGNVLHELKRFEEALASYDRALTARPDYAHALYNRGNVLHELKRFAEALASYDRALALKPDYAEAFNNRGNALLALKRTEEALVSYERAIALKPDHAHAFSGIADCVNKVCDWRRLTDIAANVIAHVTEKKSIISPFVLLGYSGNPLLQLQCARNFVADRIPSLPHPLLAGVTWRHDKVRIAYLSADFCRHATAYLMAELLERHDRSRFEIIGVSFGEDDNSEMRKRLIAAFDQFYDVRRKSDEEVAKLLRDLEVDIAIDLKGYTQDSRPGILAFRPTPIQASYLGFPGTMGAEFIDYIITDQIVAPFDHEPFYTEKIVHLPDCYQVNDSKRKISERTSTRQESGLPERGFVFCCFNNNWKITPEVFDIWMRLLKQVEGSVLWLLRDNKSAEKNLREHAQARGIDPSQLVFAGRLPLEEHLARHRLADLFLDTLPYNAHSTASDALWAGLPVLTCIGRSFAGRVAASLLNAIGLPELITSNLEEYQALALKLATKSHVLSSMRNRLKEQRLSASLFDSDRFRRNIESAYIEMWEIWQRGEAPRSFALLPPLYSPKAVRTG